MVTVAVANLEGQLADTSNRSPTVHHLRETFSRAPAAALADCGGSVCKQRGKHGVDGEQVCKLRRARKVAAQVEIHALAVGERDVL